MKLLFLFFIGFISSFSAQDYRFTYNYTYISDTLNKNNSINETVVLDFNSTERRSVFTGLKHIISDSTMIEKSKLGLSSFPDVSTKIRYVIEKENKDNHTYFYTPNHMPEKVFKINDTRIMNWEILNEKDSILGYEVQKATTSFGGRQWTAWFSTEISISDGPYKFRGLPGLILKIYDKTNTHSFEILSVQKQKSSYVVLNDKSYISAKPMSLSEYLTMDHPLEQFRKKAFTGEIFFRNNEEKQKFLKDIDIQIKENKRSENNPIEFTEK